MKLATLCYIKHEGKTLMMFRNKKPNDIHEGKWNGVGGKFEAGETPEECARREIQEETGLIAKTLDLRGVITAPLFAGGEDWYIFVYDVLSFGGSLTRECNEGDLQWIEDKKILDLNLWAGDRIFLDWMQHYRFFSGKFVYQNGVLVEHTGEVYEKKI